MTGQAHINYRKAELRDIPSLEALIEHSTHGLSTADYTPEQIAAALAWVFGVDTMLIEDGTYYVACAGEEIIACGGWSKRARPFGGANNSAMNRPDLLDPACDAAILRAFFIHPDYTGRGIAKHLVALSEAHAIAEGFRRAETTATLTGLPLYEACGYRIREKLTLQRAGYADFPACKMEKPLAASRNAVA